MFFPSYHQLITDLKNISNQKRLTLGYAPTELCMTCKLLRWLLNDEQNLERLPAASSLKLQRSKAGRQGAPQSFDFAHDWPVQIVTNRITVSTSE